MKTTLIIFSGLPGTGKSTLAHLAVQKLQLPLLAIDEVVGAIPAHMRQHANPYWDDMISILLHLAASQLELGLSVIIDSVFMGQDRYQAQELARNYQAAFRPIYTYISDEQLWEARVRQRHETAPPEIKAEVATWERLQLQRQDFYPWQPGSALFIDSLEPVEANLKRVLSFITASHVD